MNQICSTKSCDRSTAACHEQLRLKFLPSCCHLKKDQDIFVQKGTNFLVARVPVQNFLVANHVGPEEGTLSFKTNSNSGLILYV